MSEGESSLPALHDESAVWIAANSTQCMSSHGVDCIMGLPNDEDTRGLFCLEQPYDRYDSSIRPKRTGMKAMIQPMYPHSNEFGKADTSTGKEPGAQLNGPFEGL